ncbi:LysE family translocator [Neorhizobium galegae]|jgi:threonine/homoserine/homoserine lactone efflux protein|uniref:Threonine efflux protein n=1 Tax=Neorhizobium galegae bv. orientalis str. HAMBI 540 TaxID=1028800 RepID=A0A068SW24_NEOGA|nr:LysE family translocator [Neorhizobium galegae]CDN49961.1 Threonine efflux protein [Neorhizobium galegae bv. orientalis str. HAMBI 540]CDZ49895.1 Lysine exporter protein (LYSE/YGGA) [Neorhizobium galegae bv. orientalis]
MPDVLSYLPYMWPAYVAYVINVASPGPANFAIIGTSISQGRRAGLITALGIASGSLTWATAAALGLAALLRNYAIALEIMKVLGGIYLIYLAWKAYKSARLPDSKVALGNTKTNYTARQLWLRGYAIHVTNPKAIFAWLAIISLGLPDNAPTSAILLIIAVCMSSSMLIFTTYAMVFSTSHALRGYKAARRWVEGTMAVFYSVAGLKLLTSRI